MKQALNTHVKLLTGAVALSLAQLGAAQSMATSKPDAGESKTAASAKPSDSQRDASQLRDVRLSQLIGRDVRDPKGEDLGDIKDLVVDLDSGEVKYAVVAFGGFMGLGEKLFAFPLSAFRQPASDSADTGSAAAREAEGRTGDTSVRDDRRQLPTSRMGLWSSRNELVLDTEKERLEKAPGFDDDRWPDFADAGLRQRIDRYWSGRPDAARGGDQNRQGDTARGDTDRSKRGDRRAEGTGTATWRASELLDADIVSREGNDIGEIEDLVVNAQDGKLRYAVLEFDKGWLQGDKLVSVPTDALSPRDDDELTFNGTKDQLAEAPAFDREKWPNLNEPRYRGSIDRFVGNWGSGAAPMARPGGAPGQDGSTPAGGDARGGSTPAAGGGGSDSAAGKRP